PREAPRIGIEQELVGIETVAALGRIGPVHAIAVKLAGRDIIEIAVPDVLGALREFDALELATPLGVEQADVDLFRISREKREIGPPSVPACSEAGRRAGGQAHPISFRVRGRSQPAAEW